MQQQGRHLLQDQTVNSGARIFVLVGPPGAGKGTFSALCIERFGWVQISTGNVLRNHIAQGTDLGRLAEPILREGRLLEDSLMMNMVVATIHDILQQNQEEKTIILDGFPRTKKQAQLFDEYVRSAGSALCKDIQVMWFNVDAHHVERRLLDRLVCSVSSCQSVYSHVGAHAPRREDHCDKCEAKLLRRSDDHEKAVKNRIHDYYAQESELLSHYREREIPIVSLEASRSADEVIQQLLVTLTDGAL